MISIAPAKLRSLMRRAPRKSQYKAKPLVVFNRAARRNQARKWTIPPELKFFDTTMSWNFDFTMEIPATGGQLALIPQGDTQSTRDGRQCTIKSLQIRGEITGTANADADQPGLYFWIIQDKQANQAAAGVATVFSSTDAGSCFRNLSNKKRFKILHVEKCFPNKRGYVVPVVAGVNPTTTKSLSWNVEIFKKLNIPMEYSSTAGAIGEITTNNIFIIAGCCNTLQDDVYAFGGQARVRFLG